MSERAWLVEWRFNGVQWLYLWTSAPGGFSFTSDASKALRFARREDAEAALQWARDTDAARRPIGSLSRHGLALGEMLVTEHEWLAAAPALTATPQAAEPTRSQKMRAAGFTARDRRLTCDECGTKFTAQFAPLHECAPQAAQAQPSAKAERVRALVNAGPFPGMSEAFDAHMGAACWTEPEYRPDAAMWAAAWKAAQAQPQEQARKAYGKLLQIAAEWAQRKPLDNFARLDGVSHIGRRQFAAAYGPTHDLCSSYAIRLRDAADELMKAAQPQEPPRSAPLTGIERQCCGTLRSSRHRANCPLRGISTPKEQR